MYLWLEHLYLDEPLYRRKVSHLYSVLKNKCDLRQSGFETTLSNRSRFAWFLSQCSGKLVLSRPQKCLKFFSNHQSLVRSNLPSVKQKQFNSSDWLTNSCAKSTQTPWFWESLAWVPCLIPPKPGVGESFLRKVWIYPCSLWTKWPQIPPKTSTTNTVSSPRNSSAREKRAFSNRTRFVPFRRWNQLNWWRCCLLLKSHDFFSCVLVQDTRMSKLYLAKLSSLLQR